MEIEAFLKEVKELYTHLLEFIDESDDFTNNLDSLIQILHKQDILKNEEKILDFFYLITKIVDNHHRTANFFEKIEKIIEILFKDIKLNIPSSEYFKINKRIFLFLLEKGIFVPTESFLKVILITKDDNGFKNSHFLYSGLKQYLNESRQKSIEAEITKTYDEEVENFIKKCRIGENDSYICSLIRQDSIEEFISYVNRTNTSLMTVIKPSIYETNTFLMKKAHNLIEYASFFGSIQVIQYLQYNNVPIKNNLCLFSIHSNNPELIHYLEEKEAFSSDTDYNVILKESIKCHHNDISVYIFDNFLSKKSQQKFDEIFDIEIIDFKNYFFYPNRISDEIFSKENSYRGFNLSYLCKSLKTVTIPLSVTSIGKNAFINCTTLTQIIIPNSVTSIGDGAFSGCSSLKQISIPSSVVSFGKRIFYRVKNLDISGDLKNIPDDLFYDCSSLISVTIPESVVSIGDNSFRNCISLKHISLSPSTTLINKNAFSRCSSLTQIIIPDSVTSINDSAFAECSSLTQISIPNSVTSINKYAFAECSSLTQIIIPDSVTSINDSAFAECSSLTQIIIPDSVTSINNYVFARCSSLTQISIPNSVTSINKYAFAECFSLTQISIPNSVTSINNYAFAGCSSLTQISIPNSVLLIGEYAFAYCQTLEAVLFEEHSKLQKIEAYAFYLCHSLINISFHSSNFEISDKAFYGCTSFEISPDLPIIKSDDKEENNDTKVNNNERENKNEEVNNDNKESCQIY